MYLRLRLFFPLGGTGRDDIAARLLLHQLHTTAEANHSLRTDVCSKSVEVFFWLVKLSDLKMFGMSFVIFFFRFRKLESIEIRCEFCGTAAQKSLKHPLAQNQIPLGAMPWNFCHFPNKTSNIHVCCLRRVLTGLTCGLGDMLAQGKRFCSGVFWKTHVTWLGWRLYCIWKEWCKKPH